MRALAISLLAVFLLGADAPGSDAGHESGTLTLDQLLRHMATTRGVVAEFREVKLLALLDAPLETRGTLYFVPPDKLARVTRSPAETRLLLTGDRMRFEDEAGASDVDLSANPVARQFAKNLIVLWRGDRAALEAVYTLDFSAEGALWKLALTPRGAPLDRFITHIRLGGDGPKILDMDLLESDGDRTHTVFEKTEVDHAFGPDEEQAIFGPKGTSP
ncbi:MAG: outer membrane lipoprotein carrier protein LolA [Myxococcota bacterium]